MSARKRGVVAACFDELLAASLRLRCCAPMRGPERPESAGDETCGPISRPCLLAYIVTSARDPRDHRRLEKPDASCARKRSGN